MPHAQELHSQVRALAYRVSQGEISWADYREKRQDAVHRIVSGELALEYAKPIIRDDPTTPKHHDIDQVYIDLAALEREPNRLPAYIAVGVLAVVILGAGWLAVQSLRPPVVATAPVVEMGAAETVLHSFLQGADWSDEALDRTIAAWTVLTPEERAQGRQTVAWRRLQNALRQRINQQQALASVDETGVAAEHQSALVAFRDALNSP